MLGLPNFGPFALSLAASMAEPSDGRSSNRGRKHPPVISENFTRLGAVANKSGRYYWQCYHCGPGSKDGDRIEGRDNNLLNHLVDPKKCPNASQLVRYDAGIALRGKGAVDTVSVLLPDEVAPPAQTGSTDASTVTEAGPLDGTSEPPAKRPRTLDNYFDHSISSDQAERANIKLLRYVILYIISTFVLTARLRYIIHANASFRTSGNWYFVDFVREIRPSYIPASPYVLSHRLLDAENVRVQMEEIKRLENRPFLTLLFDGWEDLLKRSLYGSIAAEVKQHPIVLSLDDLTGQRGNVPTLLETTRRATSAMNVGDMKKFIAVTTDNPTSMQAYRRELQKLYPWLLVSSRTDDYVAFAHYLMPVSVYSSSHASFMVLTQ